MCIFFHVAKWGDLPILTQAIDNDETALIEANKRSPRNEVARFILKDLDLAAEYMTPNFEPRHTRISQDCAYLMKSRVALFEGSWLTNFKDTPFVPNGKDGLVLSKSIIKIISFQQAILIKKPNSFSESCRSS